MRLTSILLAPRALDTQFSWLATLKVAQLQRIARATGIQSSGTKSVLAARIEATLSRQFALASRQNTNTSASHEWSVLSIDMGIQNLAFAHLRVPRISGVQMTARAPSRPVLTAWHRLKVSAIGELDLNGTGTKTDGVTIAGLTSESATQATLPAQTLIKTDAVADLKETFSPDRYAEMAYTLITSLVSAYKPTHILIERQRFRSGGGSAVQEWTLRVGVLEGMLYAVLHALRHERGWDLAGVEVHGIEPKRVVRYWEDLSSAASPEEVDSAKRGRATAREVKKAKIDRVGRWLDACLQSETSLDGISSSSDGQVGLGAAVDGKICLAEEKHAVHDLAREYLQKWRGDGTRRKRLSLAGSSSDIGKLDDLADCLLQGVTWLEWQVMRERLTQEGLKAFDMPQ